ncbi:hypothetical protein [Aureitalea marina]|uniref:Competence protein n=1 Tax=Aureitalea marina TaxID=930804 RepID=A0A2S7KMI7_9FLAO|nr:hypothetical protein [Aureitalea marina]PQB03800.1 hypothetical protein BST85_01935 [Aureitalea marina]
MAFEDVKESTDQIQQDTQEYLEQTEAYIQLKIFQVLMKMVVGSIQFIILGLLGSIIFLLLSIGLAVYLGEYLDNVIAGYLLVAGGYAVLGLILYVLRNSLNKRIIGRFSTLFFEQE